MAHPSTAELLQLDIEERLDLIETLWNSLASDPSAAASLPVTDEERTLLDERLRAHRADPAAARPWAEIRDELLGTRR